MSLEEQFKSAADKVTGFTKRPSDKELLELYALFKQGTVGDNTTAQPGMFDLKGKAKWNAWNERKGMSQDDAKKAYVELVEKISASYQ